MCCLTSEPLIGLDVDGGRGGLLVKRKPVTQVLQENFLLLLLFKETVFFSTKVELNNSDSRGGTNKHKIRLRMLTADAFLSAIHCSI